MNKQYNAAQRILINLGGLAAMAVALPDPADTKTEPEVKRRKISYGASLRAHFDRVGWMGRKNRRLAAGV